MNKAQLVESMENAGLKNISNDSFKVTYVAATQKSTFDRKSFEKKYPVLCKEFISYSDVSDEMEYQYSLYRHNGQDPYIEAEISLPQEAGLHIGDRCTLTISKA